MTQHNIQLFSDNIIIAWVIALSSVGLNQINVRALSERKDHCKNNHGNSNLCSNALNYQNFSSSSLSDVLKFPFLENDLA
jgi:hypothetical protein